MEVKKIVEGMTAQQVAQVIDENFNGLNGEKATVEAVADVQKNVNRSDDNTGVLSYPEYSSTEPVAVGDVRRYEGLLYRAKEAGAYDWDPEKWERVTLKQLEDEKLSELGSEVDEINKSVEGIERYYEFAQPITANGKIGEFNVDIKKGEIFKLTINRNYISKTGGRVYQNAAPDLLSVINVNGEISIVAEKDITKLIFWDGSDTEGVMNVTFSIERKVATRDEFKEISSEISQISSQLNSVKDDLYGRNENYSFHQGITSARRLIGTIDIEAKKGETFKLTVSRDYMSLTGGRVYQNAVSNLLLARIPNGETTIVASDNISKLLFYDDSDTEGLMDVRIEIENIFMAKSDLEDVKKEFDKNATELKNELYGVEESYEFKQPISAERAKLGEFTVNLKKGDVFTISVQRTYDSLTRGRMYQNAAPNLFSELPNGEREYEAEIDINKFIVYDDSNTEGIITLTYKKSAKFVSKKDFDKLGDLTNPYEGLYGTVIGDSHAVRRASWVPQVYSRLGVNYDANVASFIVGQGNSCGEGYEDCIDPVFAQAKRAVESYNNGKKIDFVLLDNVHYVYESDIKPVIPFKMNQIVDFGKMEGSSSQEKNWFSENFSSLISNVEQKLGTTLKSTWARKKYDLTFSGTTVAGTSFSIIINGKTYDTPINEGDTLNAFTERVATWVFGEEWTSTSKNNVVTITYNGNGSAPTLNISYNANGSGLTMISTEGEVESSVYRYYQRKDFADWNNISAWGLVSSWFAGGLKGAVEYLLENIPTVKIVIISLPYYPIKKSDFLTELGQDQEAFLNSSTYTVNRKRVTLMKNIAEYYNLPFVDFEKDAYISLSNYFNYFPENDVHPYKIGYERLADCICTKLGF